MEVRVIRARDGVYDLFGQDGEFLRAFGHPDNLLTYLAESRATVVEFIDRYGL